MRSRWGPTIALTITMIAACTMATAPTTALAPTDAPTLSLTASAIVAPSAPPAPASSSVGAATVPVAWTRYASPARGYSVEYPSDWTGTPATIDWPADGFSFPDDPAVDKWAPPTPGSSWVLLIIATQPLKAGETPKQRLTRLDTDNAASCDLSNRRSVTVSGEAGRRDDGKCFGTDYISEAAVIHGGRSYLIYVLSGGALEASTLATFQRFLDSFRFT